MNQLKYFLKHKKWVIYCEIVKNVFDLMKNEHFFIFELNRIKFYAIPR
jgi:hypothetical protein